MTTETPLAFARGETWQITFDANDASGQPLSLTGATVSFRVATLRGVVVLDTPPAAVTITNAAQGLALIAALPAQTSAIVAGVYRYEVRVTLASGVVSVQAAGSLRVDPSLF